MNERSVFKKLVCPECKRWIADTTGKARLSCPKCGIPCVTSEKWSVRITRNGKSIMKSVSTRRQDAIDYLHSAKDCVRRNALLPGEETPIQWKDAKEAFEKWIESSGIADKTQDFYTSCLKHLNNYFTEPLQSITVKMVEDYRDSRTASPKTVAEEIKTLKRIYSLYCRWNSARTSPQLHAVASDLSKVEMPKYNNKRTRYLSKEEARYLVENCTIPHLKLAIQIGLGTGWRHSMVMGLEWRQIDFINRTVTFESDSMKSRRTFVSPLMSYLSELLIAWRKEQSTKKISRYVFPSPTRQNQPMADMQTSWENLIDSCNKDLKRKKMTLFSDVCFHTLRHTFASQFLMDGGDLATLSELLDHASIQITKDRYGHLSGEHKRNAIDRFQGVFFNSVANR